jgi:hypothetical protein
VEQARDATGRGRRDRDPVDRVGRQRDDAPTAGSRPPPPDPRRRPRCGRSRRDRLRGAVRDRSSLDRRLGQPN